MVKKLIPLLFILILSVLSASYTYADESPEAKLRGPEILRVDDTLSVVYSVNNIECSGFQGTVSYNKDLMLLSDAKAFDNSWNVEVMPNGMFLAYSKTPTDSESFFKGGDLFCLTFTIKSAAKTDDALMLDITSVIAATVTPNGDSEVPIGDTSYVKRIDPPASSDANITELSITGISFSPAFSPDVTEYTIPIGVDYTVNSLKFNIVLSHQKASYEIIGNELSVGNNTVTIKVKAEDGSEKEYTVKVKRAHDPSKPLSNDTRLSSLSISAGTLSPAFSPDIRQYAVYLPHGTELLDVSALPLNEFASDIAPMTYTLKEGNNTIRVTCIAEDSSKGEYIINVYVMPEYLGFIPEINNKIPLSSTVLIDGVLNVGQTIKASLADTDESAYTVFWYRQGEKVSEGALYTLTDSDLNTVIHAEIIGIGNYSGYFVSEKMYVNSDGIAIDLDDYVSTPVKTINMGYTVMWVTISAALFLAIGFLAGNVKKKQSDNNQP